MVSIWHDFDLGTLKAIYCGIVRINSIAFNFLNYPLSGNQRGRMKGKGMTVSRVAGLGGTERRGRQLMMNACGPEDDLTQYQEQ